MSTPAERKARREYQARYRAEQKRKTGRAQKSYGKQWAKDHPEANAAHSRQARAVASGRKKPPPAGKVAHHDKGYGSDSTRNVTRKTNARKKHRG